MNAVIYVRVSSDEQVQGTSLETQIDQCQSYCNAKGLYVLSVFREEGASAKSAERPELLRAMEFCRKNKETVTAFVVAKVDRFARNTEDHFSVRRMLADYGTTLHSVSEPIGNSPTEKFLETLLAATAEFDNAIRRQRCTDGMRARLSQGIWPFRPPIGYLIQGSKRRGEKKLRPDPPDPILFPIVQKGLLEFASGRIRTLPALASFLDAQGLDVVIGRKSTRQFADRITSILLPFYAGDVTNPWTGEVVPGQHIPMITKKDMQRIIERRSGRKKPTVSRCRVHSEFPLRRTIRCATCSRPLTGSISKGRHARYAYYHCANSKCIEYGKSIKKEALENAFAGLLVNLSPSPNQLEHFAHTVEQSQSEAETLRGAIIDEATERIESLRKRRDRVLDMCESGACSRDECVQRCAAIDAEITEAVAAMDRLDLRTVMCDLSTRAKLFLSDLKREWLQMLPAFKERFQKMVFPEGIPYDRKSGLGTAKPALILELFRSIDHQVSAWVDLGGLGWNRMNAELESINAFCEELDDATEEACGSAVSAKSLMSLSP